MNALTPYMTWIKVGALALAILLSFRAGCSVQKSRDAATIAKKDAAIQAGATALRASNAAIREIEAEAQARIKAAEEQAKAGQQAEKALERAQAAAVKAQASFDRQLANARRKPTCAALFDADIAKTCGVTPR